ncbi:protein DMR6-LIKE OXYGENASE 2 isoform X2 [Cryptomeria japonica]|uniref:protein DMR6-LIKE OXYGENASE 2 isoform X2 n=1 Tax=Cryptomeria japonica TaxID=3369 RepID=UPI0027DA0878|nr:protein DMR6-LIKE OXYGENASE 2 isoform X2 [Cryptomeria japonica]
MLSFIINHGVSEELMENMMEVSNGFFKMPVEDHAELYIENPKATARLYTSSIVGKEKVCNWREILRLSCQYPLEQTINSWPPKPQAFRDIAAKYCTEVRALILRILTAISEALGLDPDYLSKCMGTHRQVMAVNYYPMCPNPELTFGIPPHSDPTVVTVLQQGDLSGLQVLKNGKWIAVEPIPNAFVVNVADQLEVISNGRFRSVEHRAVTNSTKARISIPTFYGPSTDAFIAPAKSLVIEECGHPALYRGFIFEEYLKKYKSQELKSKTVLDCFKINIE